MRTGLRPVHGGSHLAGIDVLLQDSCGHTPHTPPFASAPSLPASISRAICVQAIAITSVTPWKAGGKAGDWVVFLAGGAFDQRRGLSFIGRLPQFQLARDLT